MKRVLLVLAVIVVVALMVGCFWAYTPDRSRAELEAKYKVSPSDYVEVAGIRLHVRDTGPRGAPAIVLLHGFGSSLDTWDAWSDDLSRDYRVIRYDLPGYALTGPDPTGDYSDARSLTILAALLDRLGVARATVVGNSMGGRIAWKFAAAYPDRVERLVLISPDGFASPGFEYGKKPEIPALLRLFPYVLPKMSVRMSLAPAYADPAAMRDSTLTRYWDLMRAPGVRDAMLAQMGQIVPTDPEPILKTLTVPTLLIWGEKDGMIPFTNAADYVRVIKMSTLAALPNLGHVPQEEAPDQSLKPLRDFLAKTAAAPPP